MAKRPIQRAIRCPAAASLSASSSASPSSPALTLPRSSAKLIRPLWLPHPWSFQRQDTRTLLMSMLEDGIQRGDTCGSVIGRSPDVSRTVQGTAPSSCCSCTPLSPCTSENMRMASLEGSTTALRRLQKAARLMTSLSSRPPWALSRARARWSGYSGSVQTASRQTLDTFQGPKVPRSGTRQTPESVSMREKTSGGKASSNLTGRLVSSDSTPFGSSASIFAVIITCCGVGSSVGCTTFA